MIIKHVENQGVREILGEDDAKKELIKNSVRRK
jgi:hypothetical protein